MSKGCPHGSGVVLAAGLFGAVLVRTRSFALVMLVPGRSDVLLPVGMRRLVLGPRRTSRVLVLMSGSRRDRHGQRANDLPKEHVEEDHQ